MYKLFFLISITILFTNCHHESVEQQTVELLQGKWEVYEKRSINLQTNEVKIQKDHYDMRILSPWYGGDTGLNFKNSDVSARIGFNSDWDSNLKSHFTYIHPNRIQFELTWTGAQNATISTEIVKLESNELWLKKENPAPQDISEIRLKRVQ